jgi:ABC-type multidrug transport system fused ATPase/permease subunit
VEGTPVIREMNLRIRRGSRVGFIGRTGSGKSTLIDLIMGLLFPTHGVLSFNGIPVTPDNVRTLQDRIAHVPQAIFLADASIAENIAFGVPSSRIDLDRVQAAAAKAQLAEFVTSLPRGYDTQVGERGVRLSGGQRQRIGIARAFYKDADILILDEATSALDDATEARIMRAIHESDPDITVLMIAHRTSSLVHCEVVYEIADGRIVREGGQHDLGLDQTAAPDRIRGRSAELQEVR